jgi:predicted dehydrogenase
MIAGTGRLAGGSIMDPKVAFIGLGVMAHRMLGNMDRYGGFTLQGGWDPDPDACRAARAAHSGLAIAGSPETLIEDPATDLVYVASPPAFHAEYALAAASAGKTIFCEKPLGIDLAGSRDLVARIEAAGVNNAVNFPFAEAAVVDALETGLADGSIGPVAAVDVRLHFCRWPRDWQAPAAWLGERTQGGFVRETFSHYAFLARKLFGPVELRGAVNRYPSDGRSAETHTLALLDCGGVPVTFAGGVGGPESNAPDRVEFTVWGAKAAYRLYDWNRLRVHDGTGWSERLTDIEDHRQDGYRRMLGNLGRFLAGEPHTLPPFREALAVQELVESILATGRP